uniref:hypothetical protein n=1 Tax=Marinimicrobium alkaliphilum TaxID=2202654 RepID=UPI001300A23D
VQVTRVIPVEALILDQPQARQACPNTVDPAIAWRVGAVLAHAVAVQSVGDIASNIHGLRPVVGGTGGAINVHRIREPVQMAVLIVMLNTIVVEVRTAAGGVENLEDPPVLVVGDAFVMGLELTSITTKAPTPPTR